MFFNCLYSTLCLLGYLSFVDGAPQGCSFETLSGKGHPRFGVVEEAFQTIIAPLYGDQEETLRKIARGNDRTCLVLVQNNDPKGILVFKKELSNEYEREFSIANSLEVKTLCLLNLRENKGRGFGTALLTRAKDESRARGASGAHLTVSENLDVLGFYLKQDFRVQAVWPDKFRAGDNELLLYWRNKQGDL